MSTGTVVTSKSIKRHPAGERRTCDDEGGVRYEKKNKTKKPSDSVPSFVLGVNTVLLGPGVNTWTWIGGKERSKKS